MRPKKMYGFLPFSERSEDFSSVQSSLWGVTQKKIFGVQKYAHCNAPSYAVYPHFSEPKTDQGLKS